MSRNSKDLLEETPHDMMKRVFAVAELIVRSDDIRPSAMGSSEDSQKHKSEDSLYRIGQRERSGSKYGTKET